MEWLNNCAVLKIDNQKMVLEDADKVDLTLMNGDVLHGLDFRFEDSAEDDLAFLDESGHATIVVDVQGIKDIKVVM